ncbi:MAG: DNA primase [Planctomycetes bacterium]|nr:DNA primase [Planctomycetota bacterium]
MNDDLRRAIDEIKLRTSVEDVVRERVPSLRKRGRLWEACCPFHEEKTPSFKVDPQRGTWHCFGACATGGDAIRFVERSQNVDFIEALRYLAARSGVTLPDRRTERDRAEDVEREQVYGALARASDFYRRALHTPQGAPALDYLRSRGLERATIDAFGVGYAPAGGEVLSERARSAGVGEEWLIRAGLARKDERGRIYDFFRDRLMIPIRDLKGRVVGFGGRRLSDGDPRNPKYVNTSETEIFHKGRLIYALDLALEHVRRSGHLMLVEGYTDVMAAHQVGLRTVVAVLGTATTDEHAGLVRKSGARRVSLVFDGDEAGRKATYKALAGLLSLEVEIDVVRIPGDEDPCDLLIREGAAPMEALLAQPTPWFDFVVAGLLELAPTQRARAIDAALELVARLPRALDRDAHLALLAERLGFPLDGVRMQFETLPTRARERQRAAVAAPVPEAVRDAEPVRSRDDELVRRAFGELAGVAMLEARFARELAPLVELCRDADEHTLLAAIARVAAGLGPELDPERPVEFPVQALYTELGEHPARLLVMSLLDHAERAEDRDTLFEEARAYVERAQDKRRIESERRLLGKGDDGERMAELYERFRRIKVPRTDPTTVTHAESHTETQTGRR